MPIELRDHRALEGPNLYYGQPAVKLQTWSDRDIRRDLGNAIKTWAQATGSVIGALEQDLAEVNGGYLITTTFTTPYPNVGERIVEGAVADLQAAEQNDKDYSHDDLLFEVLRLRQREEPPIALLQIYAEARARELPFLPREDGKVMVGSGARGYIFDPSGLSLGLSVEIPWEDVGRIPVLAVSGTNGKTTTVRLCAHILESTGKRVGRTDTDGITIAGEVVEHGDWAGFGGARRVLSDPRVDVAVLETSRGGILRRGLGFDICDVSVITNVSADHLGELGVDTLEEMARVKGVIALVTRPDGRVVLNAADDRLAELEPYIGAPIMWFSRDPAHPRLLAHLASGGDAVWSDGERVHIAFAEARSEFALADIPIVAGGAAEHNVENVLAATAACVALGVDVATVARALRDFGRSEGDNAGRLNIFRGHGVTAVLDYAHNEAAMAALVNFGRRLQSTQGGRLIVVLGGPGDRPDAQLEAQGHVAGAAADWLLLHEEERYLRGRPFGEASTLYRKGALEAGLAPDHILPFPDEVVAVRHALQMAAEHDVVLAAAHAQQQAVLAVLHEWQARGST
jgi:cyanophycin synthetase